MNTNDFKQINQFMGKFVNQSNNRPPVTPE